MKKNLFLAGALALFAVVGVSAQNNWSRTLATGLPGEEITHKVGDADVTQYRATSGLLKNAGANGVRYTVLQTGTGNQIKGGGPCFALGEMIVLDAKGDTIGYTVTSNADHNTMGGAGNDGDGMPALNDGNLNNYFHSTWSENAPNELHYIELTFEKSLDEFQLVWYTRPNQHVNKPQIVGLTNPGVVFTEDMLFAEYGFKLGDKVTSKADIANGGTFVFYVEGEEDLSSYGDYTGNGNTYIALSGYTTGSSKTAGPQNIVQFIPTSAGEFILYQPVSATYYANPDRWTDGYNGKNGWQRAYSEAWTLATYEINAVAGGFELTTYATRQYVDGAWVEYEEPLKLWVGYDMRGNLKLFPQNVKEGLENGDYTLGFGLPVDFSFEIFKADVNKELVPDMTGKQMCDELIAPVIETAKEMKEKYAEWLEYDVEGIAKALDDAIAAAQDAVEAEDVAGAFAAMEELEDAIADYVSLKAIYYDEEGYAELEAEYNAHNAGNPPYTQDDKGKYTLESKKILDKIGELVAECFKGASYSRMEAIYAQIDTLIEQFRDSKLQFTEFPAIVSDIKDNNFPHSDLPNNAVWNQSINLTKGVKGIRLTFLDRHIGSAGDGGNFPMIAIGEFIVYDADGDTVKLTADSFFANHTETQEGFDSTVERLCDRNFGAQGYYHSPWSGAEPQEYIYLDVTFPDAMESFSFELFSRDKSTSQGMVSLFPKKVAITELGVAYDPLLFTENPYNVYVGEKVTSVDQITSDGYYVIKGLLNTNDVYKEVTEGEGDAAVTSIKLVESDGTAMFYHGINGYHAEDAAVRADAVYRFVKNDDGTFKALNLGLAQYWPSTEETGYVSGTTYEADEAANLNIVPSTNIAGAFLMYEEIAGLTTDGDSIDTDEDGKYDKVEKVYETPYVMFMDWAGSNGRYLATRPVTAPQPVETSAELADNWGDAQCFNKENGEAEWEIYKVSIQNPDFFYLTNLTGAFDQLGLVVGTNPGEVSQLGNLEGVLAEGKRVVAEYAYDEAAAAAAALAKEIAAVNKLEKNPMKPGVYQIVSAYGDFKAKQGKEKALYANVTEDGTPTFGWKNLEDGAKEFCFEFEKAKATVVEDLVSSGNISEEEGALVYTIRVIDANEGDTPYYVGEASAQSTPIDLFSEGGSSYLVLNATGSAFNFRLAGSGAGMSIHANGHGSGAGQNGNVVYWDGAPGASQWFLRAVDTENWTSIDDFVVEGTEVVAVSYFTPAGAAVPAPVKGINVVVTVYANGVVETKKVLVK